MSVSTLTHTKCNREQASKHGYRVKVFFFFLNAFFVSQFQLRLCDMNSNVTCYGSLLCREKSVHCNMRHLEYCMSRSSGLYWWFTVVLCTFDLGALFYHLQRNLVAAQDTVTDSLQRGGKKQRKKTWQHRNIECVLVYFCLEWLLREEEMVYVVLIPGSDLIMIPIFVLGVWISVLNLSWLPFSST